GTSILEWVCQCHLSCPSTEYSPTTHPLHRISPTHLVLSLSRAVRSPLFPQWVVPGKHKKREGFNVERVLGIGGVFFKARDPRALATWSRDHRGVPVEVPQP